MEKDSLTKFIEGIRQVWGPLDSELVMNAQALMEELVRTPISESWLAALQGDLDESRELYRDPEHGFIILAHTEHEGCIGSPMIMGMDGFSTPYSVVKWKWERSAGFKAN